MFLSNKNMEGSMNLSEVQKIARTKGLRFNPKADKVELVRSIQKAEGNFDCFGTAKGSCDQSTCLWKKDCLELK